MRLTYWMLWITVIAAMHAAPAWGQSEKDPAVEAAKPVGRASLKCTLIDARSKRPIFGAQAHVGPQNVTLADEAGTLLVQLDAQETRVEFSAPGYTLSSRMVAPKEGETLALQIELEKDMPPVEGPESVRLCYEVALARNPSIRGHVTLGWRIDSRGVPQDVRLMSSTVHDARLDQCVLRALKLERFPPAVGPHQRVKFPFLFGERAPL